METLQKNDKWLRFPRKQHRGVLLDAEVCRIRTRPFDPQWQDITTVVCSLIRHGFGWLSCKCNYFVMAQLLHPKEIWDPAYRGPDGRLVPQVMQMNVSRLSRRGSRPRRSFVGPLGEASYE
jgi:hypothetical protein